MRRPVSRFVSLVALAASAAFAGGCGEDPISPRAVAGRYVLSGLAQDGSPAADTLVLGVDGGGERRWHIGYAPGTTASQALVYRIDGQRILVTYHCPDGGFDSCIAGPHASGTFGPGTLTLRSLLNTLGPRPTEVFQRRDTDD